MQARLVLVGLPGESPAGRSHPRFLAVTNMCNRGGSLDRKPDIRPGPPPIQLRTPGIHQYPALRARRIDRLGGTGMDLGGRFGVRARAKWLEAAGRLDSMLRPLPEDSRSGNY